VSSCRVVSIGAIIAVVLSAGSGCLGVASREQAAPASGNAGARGANGSGPADRPHGPRERVTTVTLVLAVSDVAAASRGLRSAVRRTEGYVQSGTESKDDDDDRSARFDVRIPAGSLDAFRTAARKLGDVELETEEVEDVGEQHADLDARLRNARREEERLLGLLSERTASLGDLVALERRLGEVRERIERLDTEQRVLVDRIAYARVHAELRPREIAFWKQPGETLLQSGRWGVDAACAVVVGTGAAIAGLGPTVLVLAFGVLGLALGIRALARRRPPGPRRAPAP